MPIAEKLVLPQGYGQTTQTLVWEQVRAQLEHAKQYWLATNRGDGSPHVVPVDGLWSTTSGTTEAAPKPSTCKWCGRIRR
jgi:hypothetical protein